MRRRAAKVRILLKRISHWEQEEGGAAALKAASVSAV
jgi:hypothetical protein